MHHLKDLPAETLWPYLLEAIELDIREYVLLRTANVARGAETAELAALLVDKYCGGMAKVLCIAGLDSEVCAEGDRRVREIDPDFDEHRRAQWAARPASLATHTEAAA